MAGALAQLDPQQADTPPPQGALSAGQPQQPAAGTPPMQPPVPQAQGNSALGSLIQLMQQRMQAFPGDLAAAQQQRQQAAKQYEDLVQNAGRMNGLEALQQGMANYSHPGDPGGALRAGIANQIMQKQLNAQRDIEAGGINYGEMGKLPGETIEAAKTMGGMGGIAGLARSNMVTDRVMASQFMQIYKAAFNKFAGDHDPQAHDKALEVARQVTGATPEDAATLGMALSRTPAQPNGPTAPPAAGEPSQQGQAQPDTVAPTVNRSAWADALLAKQKLAEQRGDFTQAMELSRARQAMLSAPAQQQPTAMIAQPGGSNLPLHADVGSAANWQATVKGAEKGAEETQSQRTKYEEQLQQESADASRMSVALDSIQKNLNNMTPGPSTPYKKLLTAWSQSLGFPVSQKQIDEAGSIEAVNKINLQLATASSKAISSRPTQIEFQKMVEANPGGTMTPQGMQLVMNYLRTISQLPLQKQQEFQQWKENVAPSETPTSFDSYWNTKVSKHPGLQGIDMQDILDTMKARGWTFNQTVHKLLSRKVQ